MHIHNGTSCTGNRKDQFANAGMHYNPCKTKHPHHAGDLLSLLENNGYAFEIFITNRFSVKEIIGKTVIIHSDPDDFKFIVDTYWLAIAGQDPAEFIEKLGDRVAAVHFKDLTLDLNTPIMAEVMEGNLNWEKIFAACEKSGAQYALVEQDICQRNPFESMEISYNNLLKKGFC